MRQEILTLPGTIVRQRIKAKSTNVWESAMKDKDFSAFTNVAVLNLDLKTLQEDQLEVLKVLADYCQAMCDKDINTLQEFVSPDYRYRHMSGKLQTPQEYFKDIQNNKLNYFHIGIERPVIQVNQDAASIDYTAVLDANAYGYRGVFPMRQNQHFKKEMESGY